MRDKREIKNSAIATVIGGLILSLLLWCFSHIAELQNKLHAISVWANSSEFVLLAIILLCLLATKVLLRSTLKSRIAGFRKRIFKLFR